MNKLKKYIFTLISCLFLMICSVSLSCEEKTYEFIDTSMNADQVLESIGKNPLDYNKKDFVDYYDLYNSMDDVEFQEYLSSYNKCYEFLGIGLGIEDNYVYVYFVSRAKLYLGSYTIDGEYFEYNEVYYSGGGLPYWMKVFLPGTDISSDGSRVLSTVDWQDGNYQITSNDNTVSQGVIVSRFKAFEKKYLNNSFNIGIEKIALSQGFVEDVGYNFNYVVQKDGNVIISDNSNVYMYNFIYDKLSEDSYIYLSGLFGFLAKVTHIKLNDVIYEVEYIDYVDYYAVGIFKIKNLNFKDNGTKTYELKSVFIGNSEHILKSNERNKFRYVSEKTSVWVEAQTYVYYYKTWWIPFTGPFKTRTNVGFNLINRKTGEYINNAVAVRAVFYNKPAKKWYDVTQKVGESLDDNEIGIVNNQGELRKASKTEKGDFKAEFGNEVEYVWGFADKILSFDVIYIHSENEQGEIILGSCYENGMHAEQLSDGTWAVFDMDGVRLDDFNVDDNTGLIVDDNGNPIDTTNPDPIVKEKSFLDDVKETFNNFFGKISKIFNIILGVFILLILFKILSFIPGFSKIFIKIISLLLFPFKWLVSLFKKKNKK